MKIDISTKKNPNCYALVDDEDYQYLNQWKWSIGSTGYVVRGKKINKNHTLILMHRFILKANKGEYIDHINHNKLDNRKSNIRICTQMQNTMNSRTRKLISKTSLYKGVCWEKRYEKWHARITYNKKQMHIGYFKLEQQAAKAYDCAARILFGKYACLNGV